MTQQRSLVSIKIAMVRKLDDLCRAYWITQEQVVRIEVPRAHASLREGHRFVRHMQFPSRGAVLDICFNGEIAQ